MIVVVDPATERHLARAVGAYLDALRRNGVRPAAALVELLGALNRQEPPEFDAETEPGDHDAMALVFDVPEVAAVLRVSPRSVERLLSEGSLPSVLIGRSRRVRAEDLRRYVADLPTKGTDHE